MAKWFSEEDVELACRLYFSGTNFDYIVNHKLHPATSEEVAASMTPLEIIGVLEKKDEVFVVQTWVKEDIIKCLKKHGIEKVSEEIMSKIIEEVKPTLEDCETGRVVLDKCVDSILQQEGIV